MRDSVVFYKSFYECVKEMPPEKALMMYDAIFQFVFFDKEPELQGLERGIFQMIRAQIVANNKKYESGKKGAEYGKLGGRPKKEKTNGDIEKTPKGILGKTPKETPNENETEKGNDTVNENVSENNDFCAERKQVSSALETPPIISLLLNDKTLYDVFQADIDEWTELYPVVDVMQELRNMKGWLDGNPTKRKTRSGVRRFIHNWLTKEQNKGGNGKAGGSNGTWESPSTIRSWE